jgi:hypothetical protein
MVVTQTVVPAVIGVVLLSDEVRPGWQLPALVGLALAVWGAARLGRRPAGMVFAGTPARHEADSSR